MIEKKEDEGTGDDTGVVSMVLFSQEIDATKKAFIVNDHAIA